MWPNYPVTEQVGTAFKLRQRMKKKLLTVPHVLHKTLNLVISRFSLADYGEKIYQNLKKNVQGLDVLTTVAVVAS